jgi:hypothetical protein
MKSVRDNRFVYSIPELRNVLGGSGKSLVVKVSGVAVVIDIDETLYGLPSHRRFEVDYYSEYYVLHAII